MKKGGYPSCSIRSDSQTTGLTLTTGVCLSCTNRKGANNLNILYDVTGLLTAVQKFKLRSCLLGCLSWSGKRGVVYSAQSYLETTNYASLCGNPMGIDFFTTFYEPF